MTEQKSASGLDYQLVRRAIERSDPELMLGFYAEDAEALVISVGVKRLAKQEEGEMY